MTNRTFWSLILALLAVMAAVQVITALEENQTFDEAVHMLAGYTYLKKGDFHLNPEHPPLGKMLNALPLLMFLKPELPTKDPRWPDGDLYDLGEAFLYRNRIPADRMLFAARLVSIAVTLLLGVAIAVWARRHFGAGVAVLATFLFCTDPNFIAHGRYVATDLIAALFIFLSCVTWGRFLRTRRTRDLLLAGIMLGLALLTKFSALFLIPILVALYLIRWWQAPTGYSLRHFATSIVLLFLIGGLVVVLVYRRDTKRALKSGSIESHAFWKGYEEVTKNYSEGRDSYLLGVQGKGWWYYFPVAFAVKTPTAVLFLFAIALAAALRSLLGPERMRDLNFDWALLALPATAYFAMSLFSRMDIGFRHLLPVFPFLLIAVSAGLWRWRQGGKVWAAIIVAVVVLQVFENARIYPYYLSFFNSVSGGPANGERYLLDSNIDWGQDLKRLKVYLDAHHLPNEICTCYFGRALPRYYGIGDGYLPHTDEPEKIAALNCIAAISVTCLHDIYQRPGSYEWLRHRMPMGRVGYSMYVFDLRK